MTKTLGSYLIESLEARGVQHVFGIPGVHNIELYRGLSASRIRHVTGRHEQGLGFMADGYARVARRPGVCFTITGPGLTNIVTAMGQAYGDSIPLLVVASENRSSEIGTGRGFLHELTDQLGVAARVSGLSRRIGSPAELPAVLDEAFAGFAHARPRPAYIEIPRDLMTMDAAALPRPAAGIASGAAATAPTASAAALADAAARLGAAKSPLILAGGGALGAGAELRQIAERFDAPLVMTINARGLLPPDHPLGVSASPTLPAVRAMIAAADLVLAVGTELGQTDYDAYCVADFPAHPNLVRIDIDAAQLTRNARPALAVHADARAALQGLLAQPLGARRGGEGAQRARSATAAALAELSPAMQREIAFLDAIRDTLPEAILVGDSTQTVYAGNLGFAAARPGSWFNSATGYGTLGYALPASTGASLAAPGRPVVCLVGDGGLQFSLGELAVPRDVDAWTAIIVWNNHGYREIKAAMLGAQIEPVGVDVRPPDFSHIARAYGYPHRLIDSTGALVAALRDFAARRQTVVIEVRAEAFE
ncbi:MAG TPA: 5-guanidino-2-oxopentanoate decarboxylase [Steroidobacteraceae bacterium]|nr:5-guanidino-2-oxopentanoate decarboxylase [Steroidobacteraceae bacterium]